MNDGIVGSRLRYQNYTGSARYYGSASGTKGVWIGVEWDDPTRGRHDGVKDGVRYFHCSVPESGSFIRPSPLVDYGKSFLAALKAKYCEEFQGPDERVVLGSSNGTIDVEVVNLDMIRANLSRLDGLREVSLQDVSSIDSVDEIRDMCPMIRGLDLSESLISNWTSVKQLCAGLERLQTLCLNRTRVLVDTEISGSAFAALHTLQLNGASVSWRIAMHIIRSMPCLEHLELGFNNINSVEMSENDIKNHSLRTLNLDSNNLANWSDICTLMNWHLSLTRLFLASNTLKGIRPPEPQDAVIPQLRHLSLSGNKIDAWLSIDHLSHWAPNLESLRIQANPISTDAQIQYRQLVIARIPTLSELDAAPISSAERRDCELFYLSSIARSVSKTREDWSREHPRWEELSAKWGAPDEAPKAELSQHKLRGQLINALIQTTATRMVQGQVPILKADETIPLRILKTMSLKMLRQKVGKALKGAGKFEGPVAHMQIALYLLDKSANILDPSQDDQKVDWLGVEDDTIVLVFAE